MTEQEIFNLDNSAIYKFTFYYGEERIGILIQDVFNANHYIIKANDIRKYNDDSSLIKEIGYKINIETIKSFEAINKEEKLSTNLSNNNISVSNATKLIILGAGASYDFSFDEKLEHTDRPPLTNSLFDDEYDYILKEYQGANIFASEILQAENVEQFFQEQWNIVKNHNAPDLLNKIINTQYYLQDLFLKISANCSFNKRSNYTSLVSQISKYEIKNKKQIIVTSFNYDTLLEQALCTGLQYYYSEIDDYIDLNKKLLLFKPHGSCDWIRNFKTESDLITEPEINELFSNRLFLEKHSYAEIFKQLESEIKIERDPRTTNNNSIYPKYLPQLLIPFTDKDEFVMPKNHRDSLEHSLDKIDEILIIGWKGTEQVFKDLLNKKLKGKKIKVTVANKQDDSIKELFDDPENKIEWDIQNTFSQFMKDCNRTKDNFFT